MFLEKARKRFFWQFFYFELMPFQLYTFLKFRESHWGSNLVNTADVATDRPNKRAFFLLQLRVLFSEFLAQPVQQRRLAHFLWPSPYR